MRYESFMFRVSSPYISEYNSIRDQPGDSFYIRTMFDRTAENENELSFKKDDILHIDTTMYNGLMGVWRAWPVDDQGNKLAQWGTIPSRARSGPTHYWFSLTPVYTWDMFVFSQHSKHHEGIFLMDETYHIQLFVNKID